jgi:hypothetical protein
MPGSWQHQWYSQEFVVPLTSQRGVTLAESLNKWFAFNPCITCLQIAANWQEGAFNGQAGLVFELHFTRDFGIRYYAIEFQSSAVRSAAQQADQFFQGRPWAVGVLMADVTPTETRYADRERLLVIYCRAADLLDQDLDLKRGAVPGNDIPANSPAGAADAIYSIRRNFLLFNLSGQPWPAGVAAPAFKLSGYGNAWGGVAPCCWPAVAGEPTFFYDPLCVNPNVCGPTASFTTTEFPPPTVPPSTTSSTAPTTTAPPTTTTVLTTTEPATEPPTTTTMPPPPPPDEPPPPGSPGCHYTEYSCACDALGKNTWVLVTNACVSNNDCTDFWGNEGKTPSIVCNADEYIFQQRNACTLGNPPPAPAAPKKNDGTDCEPSCCEDKCHYVRYDCECANGESVWVLMDDECIDNENCFDNGQNTPVISCGNDQYLYTLRNGCKKGVKPATPAPNQANGQACEPDCCSEKFCMYVWQSTYNCGSSEGEEDSEEGEAGWSEPILIKRECVSTCKATNPEVDDGWVRGNYNDEEDSEEEGSVVYTCDAICTATKIICVVSECNEDDDCPEPDPDSDSEDIPAAPTFVPTVDIFTNGRINGCNLPLTYATINGTAAACSVGGRNNRFCGIESHFIASTWCKIFSDVPICDLEDYCLTTGPCTPGAPPAGCGNNGSCSWVCDFDGFGDRIRMYWTPAGTVESGVDPGALQCQGLTIIGGGTECFQAPSEGYC